MDKNFLTGKLSEYVRIKDELVETEEISEKVSMLKIRDTLLLIGNIIKEDLDEEFYIGTINAGIANKNIAFIIIKKMRGILLYAVMQGKDLSNSIQQEKLLKNLRGNF